MSKDEALQQLAAADANASEAEAAAAVAQRARREAVRVAFSAGCTASEVGAVLSVSPQRAYQIRDSRLRQLV